MNLFQSSRSTFSWGSFPSFFAFKAGILDTQISAPGGWPTVSPRFSSTVCVENNRFNGFSLTGGRQQYQNGNWEVLHHTTAMACSQFSARWRLGPLDRSSVVMHQPAVHLGGERLDPLTQLLGESGQLGVLLEQFQKLRGLLHGERLALNARRRQGLPVQRVGGGERLVAICLAGLRE